jgi:RIO kinase 1
VAHGDLSPYNTMVHDGRLVLIDLPQIIDVIANPRGGEFIARDVNNVANWFRSRGLPVDAEGLIERLHHEAGLR